ncbi:MAG TPA: nodulation protein NfeD [Thermoanaerobaculia bacterium]|nr:nodulation protein NfeD [Thermoanaerobaculia bacterium]
MRPRFQTTRAHAPKLSFFGLAAVACLVLGGLGIALAAPPPVGLSGEVILLRASSIVHPLLSEYISQGIAKADEVDAQAVVIELDTPGGLMDSTREITTAILGARTPVVVWVGPEGAHAASAGFFILQSADVAAMAPGTNTGAAHPVNGDGDDIPGVMGKKVEEDAAAQVRALAVRRGRNVQLAEAAVRESRSFTAGEALDGKLIDIVAPDLTSLLKGIEGREIVRGSKRSPLRVAGATIREIEMPAFRAALSNLANPNIALALLVLGGLGLYFELMHPGAVLPGVVGSICLVLAFWALSVLPFRSAGIALILLAVLFFIAEVKVTSYGLLTVAGIVSLVLGSMLLFDSPEPALHASSSLVAMLATFAGAMVAFLAWMALRRNRLPVRTGKEGMMHERGTARTALDPAGKIFVHGEIWAAVADAAAGPIAAGEPVEVIGIENLTLRVRSAGSGRPTAVGAQP